MFLGKKLSIIGLALALGAGSVVLAQQVQPANPAAGPQQPQRRAFARRMMRRRARMGMLRGLRQLNLTDQQKQQARSIVQTNFQSTQAQRQELRKLMEQRRAGPLDANGIARAKAVRAQLAALLTPDQKAKLEELRKARRANHPRMRRGQALLSETRFNQRFLAPLESDLGGAIF